MKQLSYFLYYLHGCAILLVKREVEILAIPTFFIFSSALLTARAAPEDGLYAELVRRFGVEARLEDPAYFLAKW